MKTDWREIVVAGPTPKFHESSSKWRSRKKTFEIRSHTLTSSKLDRWKNFRCVISVLSETRLSRNAIALPPPSMMICAAAAAGPPRSLRYRPKAAAAAAPRNHNVASKIFSRRKAPKSGTMARATVNIRGVSTQSVQLEYSSRASYWNHLFTEIIFTDDRLIIISHQTHFDVKYRI